MLTDFSVLNRCALQNLLLQRNALLERAYAMVSGGQEEAAGQQEAAGDGDQAGYRRRSSGGVESEATAWWLTDEMQVPIYMLPENSTIQPENSAMA